MLHNNIALHSYKQKTSTTCGNDLCMNIDHIYLVKSNNFDDIKQLDSVINNNVTITDSGCWLWKTNGKDKRCTVMYKKKGHSVQRLLWENLYPGQTKNKIFSPTCHNKLCVNIKHMNFVTQLKNVTKEEVWNRLKTNGRYNKNGCLIWNGPLSDGYGTVSAYRKLWKVHRLSYFVNNDISSMPDTNIEEKAYVLHTCDNKKCFNPEHLILGTHKENTEHEKLFGKILCGESNKKTTITEAVALEILHSKCEISDINYLTVAERAKKFNVSKSLIRSIDDRRSWLHLPDKQGNLPDKHIVEAKAKGDKRQRENAKTKVWTKTMYDNAKLYLKKRSSESDKIRKPFVHSKCWIWKGFKNSHGYGRGNIYGRQILTHVLAAEISSQKKPDKGQLALHKCGINLCANPDHIVFGTRRENALHSLKHGTGRNKLSEQDVQDIRDMYKKDNFSRTEMATKYKVSKSTIDLIVKNKTWTHLLQQ